MLKPTLVNHISGDPLFGKLLDCKRLKRINTLDYYENYGRKSFITLDPGACTKKLFAAIIYGFS
jgi:hypothetical protein